jgi:hypothetical protein
MVGFLQNLLHQARDARRAHGGAMTTPEAAGTAPPPVAAPVAPTQDPALRDGLLGAVRGAPPKRRGRLRWNPARGQFELEGY